MPHRACLQSEASDVYTNYPFPVPDAQGQCLLPTNAASGPYEFPNLLIDYVRDDPPDGLLVGNWRGVGETRNGFVVETVMDQLAAKAGVDPVDYRRRLLPPNSRITALLDRPADKIGRRILSIIVKRP